MYSDAQLFFNSHVKIITLRQVSLSAADLLVGLCAGCSVCVSSTGAEMSSSATAQFGVPKQLAIPITEV